MTMSVASACFVVVVVVVAAVAVVHVLVGAITIVG